jgi:SAM-dependent methyltransferase
MKENIYGHAKRLAWIKGHLARGGRVVEMGCGTGYMITLPLALEGYSITGVDPDAKSIGQGRTLFAAAGADPRRLVGGGLESVEGPVETIIVSEVLEHIPEDGLAGTLAVIREKLAPGGTLLVTVPNGWGWFEAESFLWHRIGLGRLIELARLDILWRKAKRRLGAVEEDLTPSTGAASPHLQRFTMKSARQLLEAGGFEVFERTGSVLVAGPLANLLFSGFEGIMRLNGFLGSRLPYLAAGFYLACRKGGSA